MNSTTKTILATLAGSVLTSWADGSIRNTAY